MRLRRERTGESPTQTRRVRLRRWVGRQLHSLSLAGWFTAIAAFALSMTPSLIPRAWYLQGLISGLLITVAYAAGTTVSWLLRRIGFNPLQRPRSRRIAFRTTWIAMAITLPTFGFLGARWQFQARQLVGLDPSDSYYYALMLLIAATFFCLALSIARGLRWSARTVGKRLARWIAPPVAKAVGVVVIAVLTVAAVDEALLPVVAKVANVSYSLTDADTPPGAVPPTSPARSGSPLSAVRWDDLGHEGMSFISSGPTTAELAEFSGRPAREPVRVYVGLKSASSLEEEAQLAVRELIRTGAFDRSVLAIVTPTGRGWINHSSAAALEYMWNGDTAIVAMQYSYLPSAVAFLTDLQTPEEAAQILFDAVHAVWETLPVDERPKLISLGESLGAFGSQAPFGSIDTLLSRSDGAIWVGSPRFTPLWQQVTQERSPGSSIQHPDIDGCTVVCFMNQVGDIPPGHHPKAIYIQHVNDPVVWWSTDLILHRPQWLIDPPLPGRNPSMRWIPVITFWQMAADMAVSTETPDGQAHYYGQIYADAFAALVPPPGWSGADTQRLRELITDLDTGV